MACVCSGISGWVIGLLIRGRAVAERRAANADRRCWPTARPAAVFCLGLGDRRWRSSLANRRSQPLAAGRPSDVARHAASILASAERDRSLNLLGKGAALHLGCAFPRAREGGPSAGGFDPAAPARSYGDSSARADRNRWPRGGCGVCALWHFRLGDRALDPWACGRRTARGQCWSPVLADGEARRRFLFGTWRSAVAELFANRRSQQLAAGQPSDVLALCWILASAERDRSLNLLGKGAALHLCCAFPRAREGGASASGFDPAAPARSYGDSSARADRNRWPRGGCGVCALWHFRLGDRALDPWACGRRTARGQSWSPCWPTARPAAVFCLGLGDRRWRSSSPTAARSSWPEGGLRMCSHALGFWHRPSATAP